MSSATAKKAERDESATPPGRWPRRSGPSRAKLEAALWAPAPPGRAGEPAAKDVLADFAALARFDRHGLEADIGFAAPGGPGWSAGLAAWLFDLTKANMRALYDSAPGLGVEGRQEAGRADAPRGQVPGGPRAGGRRAAGLCVLPVHDGGRV
jgi:hypothetical protein